MLGGNLVDLVVGGMHGHEPVTERREAARGEVEGVGVPIDPDHGEAGHLTQRCLGVPAHAEGGIDHDRAGIAERGSQQVHATLSEHGDVEVLGGALSHTGSVRR